MKLAKLKALIDKATPGPWAIWPGQVSDGQNDVANVRGVQIVGPRKAVSCSDEALFITTLRNELPKFIERLEAAENALHRRHIRGIFETSIESWSKLVEEQEGASA